MDSLSTPCQEAEPLPYYKSEETPQHKMARQDPSYRGAHPSQPFQHPHHLDADPATLGRPCRSHAGPSAPQELLFGELQHGKRSLGGQKKRFKDTFKMSLKPFSISHNFWEQAAMDRPKWRASVRSGAKFHEANRIAAAEQRRQDRNSRAFKSPTAATIPCPRCTRTFRARIGLTSHLRTHRDRLSQHQDD